MASAGKNIGGRAYLVATLQELGLSRRQSVRILNGILKNMALALRRGEEVEFPLGKLVRTYVWWRGERPSREWLRKRRRPYTVEWQSDEVGERLLNPEDWVGVPERRARRRRPKIGK